MPRRFALGVSLAVLSGASFGTIAIFAKLAYRAGLQVDQLLALRYGFAAVVLLSFAFLTGRTRMLLRPRAVLLMLLGLSYGAQALVFFAALRSVPASVTELILFTYPALVLLGAWRFLHHRPMARQIAAIGGSFLGIGLLIGAAEWRFSPDLAFAILAPLLYAAYLLIAEPATRGQSPAVTSSLVTLGAGILWLIVAGLRGHLTLPVGLLAWVSLGGLVALPSLVGVPSLMGAIRYLGSSRVAVLGTVEPVVTVVCAVIFLGETLSVRQGIGAAIVLTSLLLVSWVPKAGAHVVRAHP